MNETISEFKKFSNSVLSLVGYLNNGHSGNDGAKAQGQAEGTALPAERVHLRQAPGALPSWFLAGGTHPSLAWLPRAVPHSTSRAVIMH